MGLKSREKKEQRERENLIAELENRLRDMAGGQADFCMQNLPPEVRQAALEDILAFESVEDGISLFDGLQEHGLALPRPDELDEEQSAQKVMAVLNELLHLRILLVGFEEMTAREFYSTLWNQTLWEGCHMKKRNPGAFTIIDVSHRLTRDELLQSLEDLTRACTVH